MTRPPKRKRLSPREKKDMSLRKDRRFDWWEYETKGVRSKVRAASHRKARREDKRQLADDPDAAEGAFRLKQRKRWKKVAGVSLGEAIGWKSARRKEMHRARIRRHERAGETQAMLAELAKRYED